MRLYLVQHGAACAKELDAARPLTDAGRADVERLGRFLEAAGVRVARVIHSGKLRARQTAELLAAHIAPGVGSETSGLINPDDDPRAFDWQSDSWDRDTLIAGHQPFLGKLVADLVAGDEAREIARFVPGTLVCLEHADGNRRWTLIGMIQPGWLG